MRGEQSRLDEARVPPEGGGVRHHRDVHEDAHDHESGAQYLHPSCDKTQNVCDCIDSTLRATRVAIPKGNQIRWEKHSKSF